MEFFDQFDVKNLENLDLMARQVVEGFIIGLHKSPFHGFSVEFAEHRLYNQGESTRNLDWKVYARTDKMFVKKYEEETNLRCQIVIDTSSSMYFPKGIKGKKLNKLEFSALSAASLMNLLRKQRDAFGLSMYEDRLHIHSDCKSSNTHYRLLLTYLDRLINEDRIGKKSASAEALHHIAETIHRRSLVVIFSDMFEDTDDHENLFSALQHLRHAKHEVILFHVTDHSLERDFEFENRPWLFEDLETGERIKLQSNEVKDLYTKKVTAYYQELKMKCMQYRIDFIDADINAGFYPILQSYLVKRARMLK